MENKDFNVCPKCGMELTDESISIQSSKWSEESSSVSFVGSYKCPRCREQGTAQLTNIPIIMARGEKCQTCGSGDFKISSVDAIPSKVGEGGEVVVNAVVTCRRCTSGWRPMWKVLKSGLGSIVEVNISSNGVHLKRDSDRSIGKNHATDAS
jgi:DNA-directed RNA polymerase subunit RPC12/RpoP